MRTGRSQSRDGRTGLQRRSLPSTVAARQRRQTGENQTDAETRRVHVRESEKSRASIGKSTQTVYPLRPYLGLIVLYFYFVFQFTRKGYCFRTKVPTFLHLTGTRFPVFFYFYITLNSHSKTFD